MTRASATPARAPELGAVPVVPPLRSGTATDPGRVRERNEDRVHADPDRGILMVVDGIGGEAGGEKAAETAVEVMRQRLERRTGDPEERIREAIAVANNEIVTLAHNRPEWSGMGCVLTVAVVEDGTVTVGHVGDSRLYHLSDGGIEKITRDHSPVGEREDRGELPEREAMQHPRRNEVYRSVGGEQRAPFDDGFIDITRFAFGAGDALLLCSDGLTDLVPSDRIAEIVRERARDPRAVATRLVDAALAAGGKDNVSVVFAAGRRFAEQWPAAHARSGGARAGGVRPSNASATPAGTTAIGRPPAGSTATGSPAIGGRARSGAGPSAAADGGRRWLPYAIGAAVGAALAAAAFLALPRTVPAPASIAAIATGARAQVLRVGGGQRHATIGSAMAAARSGDTVLVAPGNYRETVRLADGVRLIAAVTGRSVIVPAGDASGAALIAERIGSGAVRGLAVRAGGSVDVGIRVSDAAVAIEDVEVTGARVAGVLIENGRGVVVLASRIHDNPGAGVIVRAGGVARLAHNRIEDNGRGAATPSLGVLVEGLARADLDGNVIVGHAEGVRGVPRSERAAVTARNVFQLGAKSNRVAVAALAPGGER